MNRRGFLSSLTGVVAWVKSPKIKSISPAASAIRPTYEKPFMWRVDFVNGTVAQCEEYLGRYVQADRIARWAGQAVLPVVDMDGNVRNMTAYMMCKDWETRRDKWLSTKPAPHDPVPQKSPFDGYPMGRGMLPLNCHCEDCRTFFASDPSMGSALVALTVDMSVSLGASRAG